MKTVYRIIFLNQASVYEIYAKHVGECDIFGFVEVEGLIFRELSALVLDTAEERLRNEFNGVKRTFIPSGSILRIDQVEKSGVPKARPLKNKTDSNISRFPGNFPNVGFDRSDRETET